jgi:Fe-S oxidoreductase
MTLQDPCFTARGLGDYESPRKVLSAIEGVRLVEMEHNRENGLCCGVTAMANNSPEVAGAFIRNRLGEARAADAEVVVNACAGCQMAFFGYENDFGLTARMFSEIVAEAMGIDPLPDRMKQFRDLKEPERIIEAARGNIEASEYDIDQIMAVLPFLFR